MDQTKRGFKLLNLSWKSTVLQDTTNKERDNEYSIIYGDSLEYEPIHRTRDENERPEPVQASEGSSEHQQIHQTNNENQESEIKQDGEIRSVIQNLMEECQLAEELFNNEDHSETPVEFSSSFVDNLEIPVEFSSSFIENVVLDNSQLDEVVNNVKSFTGYVPKSNSPTKSADLSSRRNAGDLIESDGNLAQISDELVCHSDIEYAIGETNRNQNMNNSDRSKTATLDDDDAYCNITESENTDSDGEEQKRSRKKRRFCDPAEWKYNSIKRRREKGLDYKGRKGNEFKLDRPSRILKDRCKCIKTETKIQCFKLSEEDRKKIFTKFWGLSWAEKKVYITSKMLRCSPKRPRNRKNVESQRSVSYQYFLNKKNEQVRVCKTLFCNTLGISMRTISEWVKNETVSSTKSGESSTTVVENTRRQDTRFEFERQNLRRFFENLPKLESHYCRKSSSKLYLEPKYKSKSELFEVYKNNWCVDNNIKSLSIATFSNMFDDYNLALFSPKKDECDVCVGYKTKNITDDLVYKEHIEKKHEARNEKEADKRSHNKVFTMDLQSVLLCPKSNVSALYYRTKLIVHNFTIFDLQTKEGYCFIWHEGEGELTANCFSSIVCKFLSSDVIPHLEANQKIILYSDGCAAQNRNSTMANGLLNLAVTENVCIEQKYLEKGHTQMECDSMHSTIERMLKGRIINVPADYINICRSARKFPKPYSVIYLDHNYFKNFANLKLIKSIRPGFKSGDPTVTDIRALRYNFNGIIEYKIRHTADFEKIPTRQKLNSNSSCSLNNLPPLYKEKLKIKKEKFEHLMALKKTLEADYHHFYDDLKHE